MDSSVESVCFSRKDFTTYMYILLILLVYIVYILYSQRECMTQIDVGGGLSREELKEKVQQLQNELYQFQLAEQRCRTELVRARSELEGSSQQKSINRIFNPLVPPERQYTGTRDNTLSTYQMIGYVYNGNDRYPLFGRYKYPGRTEKWEYYVIDETRNRLKIPFKTVNDNEISDNDTVDIPTLGNGFSAKIYDYEQFRYNPNVL